MVNKIESNLKPVNNQFNQRVNRSLDFNRVLDNVQKSWEDLKVSAHAQDRLQQRNINLTDTDMSNLKNAVDKIRDKGGKEALIIYNNIAFVTSIRNNTIITAVDSSSIKENIFTNIDSALII